MTYLTETQFINHEKFVWGDEYVESMIDRGYTPILTTAGWKWVFPSAVPVAVASRLATR